MNEFPGPGQQPTGNPGRRLTKTERDELIHEAQRVADARRQPVRAGGPVRVRIIWDAGISSPVARGLGQAEQDWFRSLVCPVPLDPRRMRDVLYLDFTLSVEDGFVVDSPALPRIAVGKTGQSRSRI